MLWVPPSFLESDFGQFPKLGRKSHQHSPWGQGVGAAARIKERHFREKELNSEREE